MDNSKQNYQHASSPLDNLRLISYCPLCNAHYNPQEAKILEQREGAHLIHVQCHSCQSSIVAVVITGGLGISSVGLITDLTSRDVMHFKNQDAIIEDDILDAYKILSTENNLKSLLKEN